MNRTSISIIMPLYNTEAYVAAAIESVLAQTFHDWELIVVNDGSTDGSLDILKRFADADPRIMLLDQPNKGVSAARNNGLSVARGKYIYFLDSDDEIVPDTLKMCIEYCDANLLDVIFFDASTRYSEGVDIERHNLTYTRTKTTGYAVRDGASTLKDLIINDEFLVVPGLLFTARHFITSNNFTFVEGIVHEDELYAAQLFLFAERTMYLPEQLFVRRLRANSTMTSAVRKYNIDCYFIVAERLKEIANDEPAYAEVIDIYLRKTLNAVLWKAHRLSFADRQSIFRQAMTDWSSYIELKSWLVLTLKKYLPKR